MDATNLNDPIFGPQLIKPRKKVWHRCNFGNREKFAIRLSCGLGSLPEKEKPVPFFFRPLGEKAASLATASLGDPFGYLGQEQNPLFPELEVSALFGEEGVIVEVRYEYTCHVADTFDTQSVLCLSDFYQGITRIKPASFYEKNGPALPETLDELEYSKIIKSEADGEIGQWVCPAVSFVFSAANVEASFTIDEPRNVCTKIVAVDIGGEWRDRMVSGHDSNLQNRSGYRQGSGNDLRTVA